MFLVPTGFFLLLGLTASSTAQSPKERAEPPIEVYDWSVWVGNPSLPMLNGTRVYRNAMPGSVGTSRPKTEGPEQDRKFAVAPISVIQTFGTPTDDVDLDLRVKKGAVLAFWPQGNERTGGLRWFKSNFLATPPAGIPLGNIMGDHWFNKLRGVEGALYLKYENRVERFVAYDTEVALPIPIKIRGGPDEYTLQNVTGTKLVDVAVIAPVDGGGYRVGWVDVLPTAVPKETVAEETAKAKVKEEEKKAQEKPEAKAKAADAIFEAADAEAKAKPKEAEKEKKDEAKPIPPEGDMNIKARVDQALNREVNVVVEQAPRKDVLALVAGQARFRYEVDEPTLLKENIDLGQPMAMKVGSIAARDALAEIIGSVGLSYRVTDDGSLFITTAARLASETGKKIVIEGPPVKLTLAPPVKPTDPTFRSATRDAYSKRLVAQGLRAEVAQTLIDQYGTALFEPKSLIVLAHLSRDAIDEVVLIDVFPTPKKLVRVALVVSHGVDPRLQDQARVLVQRLGDTSPKTREGAESELFELGSVAVPVLEDALRDKDVEIMFRAERILMKLNRPVP